MKGGIQFMEISIYTDGKGRPVVQVDGSTRDSATKVAKAYKEATTELKKGGK
jgi:hypothetical protein